MSDNSRFINICKWQLNVDAGKLLKVLAASFIINLLVLFGGGFVFSKQATISVTNLGQMDTLVEVSLCYSIMQLFLLVAVTRLIAPMTNRNRRVQFMMLPATINQKFLMRVLYLSIICGIVWVLGFVLADAVHVLAAKWFETPGGEWAIPTMLKTWQSAITSAASPGEAVDIFLQGVQAGREAGMATQADNAEIVNQALSMPEEMLTVKSFAEAGWLNICFGISTLLFSWSMCLFCGALFRTAPWVFAWIASFVLSIILAVADYTLGLGKPFMLPFYLVATVAFTWGAYRLFSKTQLIHNKLLNL